MPTYNIHAKSPDGETNTLTRDGDSRTQVLAALRAEGYAPVRVDEQSKDDGAFGGSGAGPSRPPKRRDIQSFLMNLSMLLRAGLDLDGALRSLAREEKGPLRRVLETLRERVREGDGLSVAMERAGCFTPVQVNVIRAGEYGGNLQDALRRIAETMEREEEIRSRIRNALAYPAFLVCFGLASMVVMMVVVLPKFLSIYEKMDVALPALTGAVLRSSELMSHYGVWLAPLGALVAWVGARRLMRFRENEAADRLRLRIPLLGPMLNDIEVAAFLRTLGLLIRSGVPIVQALGIVAQVSGSALFAATARVLEKNVSGGERLSAEMRRSGMFGETLLSLVAVGEEGGELGGVLLETADNMQRRIDERIKALLTLLEPLLILVVGAIIAVIVMSMLMPIFSLSAGLRRG